MPFHVKKGAADPFRGDWYLPENTFNTSGEAITMALDLTTRNYVEFGRSWDEFGYEWSVFEETKSGEKKIWEGYKAIAAMKQRRLSSPQQEDGWL